MGETSSLSTIGLNSMDLGILLTIIFFGFLLLSFIIGWFRGLKKSVIRTIWIILLGIITIFITTPLTISLVTSDISSIPFLTELLSGSKSVEEFLVLTLSQTITGIDTETLRNIVLLLTSVIAMFISGALFLTLFILFKYISLPLYWILNIFIGRTKKGKKKYRLFGGLVGVALGIIIVTFITTPFVGYINVAKQLDKATASLTSLTIALDEETENQSGIIYSTPAGEILDSLSNSPIVVIYDSVGLKKLQLYIFNETSTVVINDETVKINDEIEALSAIVSNIAPFINGTYDFTNIEALANDPEQFEALMDSVDAVILSLSQSKIIKNATAYAIPIAKTFLENTVIEVIKTNANLDSSLVDPVTTVVKDFCDGIFGANTTTIRNTVSAVFDVVKILPKLSEENILENIVIDDFETLGNCIDTFISSGLIKGESISTLVPAILDLFIKPENQTIPENFKEVLNDVKETFSTNSDIVYAKEFTAIGEIVVGISDIGLLNTESISADSIKQVGGVLDKAFSHDSVLITSEILDGVVVSLLDMVDLGEEFRDFEEIFTKIKTPFEEHSITSYTTEFDALGETISLYSLLGNEDGINFSEFGEKLDTIVSKGAKTINHEVVNDFIVVLLDEFVNVETEGIDLSNTLESIKNNFTGNDLSYKTEFECIEKLINVAGNMEDSEFDIKNFGTTFDEIIEKESKVLTRTIINSLIQDSIDLLMDSDENSEFEEQIETIKNGFNRTDLVYTNEFNAISEIMGAISDLTSSEDGFDKEQVKNFGVTLDTTISYNSKIFTRELIDDMVLSMLDSTDLGSLNSDAEFEESFNKVKAPFNTHTVTDYTKEFEAMAETISLFNSLDDEESISYLNFGERLDEIVAINAKSITRDVVNNYIQVHIDEIAEVKNEKFDFSGTLNGIKNNFTGNDLSYKTEFKCIEKLINVAGNMEDSEFDIKNLGTTFDDIIKEESKVLTRQVINTMIQDSMDSVVEIDTPSHADFTSNIQTLKNSFNRDDLNYTDEFTAIDKLKSAINLMQEENFSLIQVGINLDESIETGGKVVTKTLINSFMQSSFDDFVPKNTIDHAGALAGSLTIIKNRLGDSNFEIEKYETEFTAINKLLEISEIAGSTTITHIEDKILENNTKSISDVLDDKIKDSVLVGDSGLTEISILLKDFEEKNNGENGKRDFTKIIVIIEENFEELKPNVKCASNKNLDRENTLSYADITHAFAEAIGYLDNENKKITDQTTFDADIANRYEYVLAKLEENIILEKDGTRAIASYVAKEVSVVLENMAEEVEEYPIIASKIREIKKIILNYKNYVDRPTTLENNKLNELEPYDTTGTIEYVYSTDGFINHIEFTTEYREGMKGYYAYRNCPFSSIANELREITQQIPQL